MRRLRLAVLVLFVLVGSTSSFLPRRARVAVRGDQTMPQLVRYESWDEVTAPALPLSTWATTPGVVTVASGGVTPASSPNMLWYLSGGDAGHFFVTYATRDGNSGNVEVAASFNHSAIAGTQAVGVFARGAPNPVTFTGGTCYWAVLSASSQTLTLYRLVGGSLTTLGSISLVAALAADVWYTVSLSCNGSALSVQVTRSSDGYYLNSSGLWQVLGTVPIGTPDTSITGQGFSGLTLQATASNVYSDNWSLYTYP